MGEAAARQLADGLILGRYRPLRPLGSGGSGTVWLARDEGSGLDVALKIVAREGNAGARAEREGTAAARLRHRNCLRVYATARDDRHVYLAYEYVAGKTLREALAAGELDDAGAVEVAAQVLEALEHAHARRIVHRDVKPANVLLADGEGISVRLFDFGLAAIDGAETLTALGDVPGTLAYIPPERLRGQEAAAASDIWAVGVMLWEALAGEHPFRGRSFVETARAVEDGVPSLAERRPDLPRSLLAAVDRAVALQPGKRPDAARLARTLRHSLRIRGDGDGGVRTRELAWPERAAPAALAALAAGGVAATLPFYPYGAAPVVAAAAAAVAAVRPRAGLAVALAVPVLPLGNHALGLAIVYAAVATAWLAVFAREPRWALLPALGPLLGPLGALGLAPVLAQPLRSPVRRALAAAATVLTGVIAAGVRGSSMPLTGESAPGTLGIAQVESPVLVARELVLALTPHPALLAATAALALAAAALRYVLPRGPWFVCAWGATLLAALLLPFGGVDPLPPVAAVWITVAAVLAGEALRAGRAAEPRS